MKRPTYTEGQIECYRVILLHPDLDAKSIADKTHYSEDHVRKATLQLYASGAITRHQAGDPGAAGYPPYLYRAALGTQPFETHRRDMEAMRHAKSIVGERRGGGKKPKGGIMTKAEWEQLFIGYELLNPGMGDIIIREHIDSRTRKGLEPLLTEDDIPRLMKKVEER